MPLWETYPPAKRDKTLYIFIGFAFMLLIAAQLLISHYGKPIAPVALGLTLLALLMLILGPVMNWRRWSRDPGFQEYLKA